MARLHLELAGAKKRRPDVVPDVPCLGPSSHLPPDAPGMPLGPTRRALLAAYDAHSLRPEHPTPETAVDMYVDVKSPHAYLAVDIFRSLERDFRVRLRTRPFDIALDRIYGDAVSAPVPKPGSKVPPPTSNRARHQGRPQRTEAQWKNVKWTYADLRRLAGLRGITVFGQEKVWDSRLAIMAVAFSERYGRRAQDRYVDEAYRRTWRRELDLEDAGAIADLVAWAAGRPDAREAFLAYAAPDGPGWSELAAVQAEAEGLGIWGVPAFVVGGEMYWGKDQVPLVRKKLLEMGLARHGGVGAEVPYLWRPAEEEGGKGKL
ncbi:hypothetical protein DFJ74DRAFT_694457 [Hyaloraphidium curvatum]|nr:hypothetical protein DFJ74DRAFT_694457 [Hyaloraphidium curvatum]